MPQHRPLNPSAQVFIPSVSVQSLLPMSQKNTGAFPQVTNTSASSSAAAAAATASAAVQPQTNAIMLDSLNTGSSGVNANILEQQQQSSTSTTTTGVNTALNQLLNTTDAGQVSSAARRDRSMEELKNKA